VTARVLVVDDEALIALHTRDVLADGNFTVVGPAYRLETALALARHEPLDAAVLDINLAGLEVWPVAHVLRERGIAFVLLSGRGSALHVPDGFLRARRLTKPCQEADLLATVAEMVNLTQPSRPANPPACPTG
jgi:DNA-binding response OmpR family regulator